MTAMLRTDRLFLVPVLAIVGALGLAPGRALAADAASLESPPGKSAKKARQGKGRKDAPLKLTAPGGSSETPAERSARLKRECRGRPNAGACTGYTD